MLMFTPQTTLAFAPAPEDLDDIDFAAPVIVFSPTVPASADPEAERTASGQDTRTTAA
jgi:hypothetical protein